MVLYRICWSDEKGQTGNGERILSLDSGQSWISYLQDKYPEMKHWLSTE